MPGTDAAGGDLASRIADNRHWYHTMELAAGVVTPGFFDLRAVVERMPWPDVRGKRCLDVGTYDGFLAFELERRGAAEVVATDISDHSEWDWPPDMRAKGPAGLAVYAGPDKGLGFEIAREALGSRVERIEVSAYDLSPERIGTFDVVVCGSLLLHLRDPQRALEAMRSVCREHLLSAEEIDLALSIANPRRPVARLNGVGLLCQWWTPSVAGHRRMVVAAGFALERTTRPYTIPFGAGHPPPAGMQWLRRRALQRAVTGGEGVPHAAVLARPSVGA